MIKKCPKCQNEMHKSFEPKVAMNTEYGKTAPRTLFWRCEKCEYKEKFSV